MVNIILFGPPGSGKGTQAKLLADRFNLIHLSTGDLFRYNIKNETELGLWAKTFIDNGELVPDEVTTSMVKDFLENNTDTEGFIFDGYPRTITQAEDLDSLMKEVLSSDIQLTLALEVPDEIIVNRLLDRGKTSERVDDSNEEIIKTRIEEYYNKTAPVADYYKNQAKYVDVNGVGEIEEINQKLAEEIQNQKK